MVGLDDLRGLFQSMILYRALRSLQLMDFSIWDFPGHHCSCTADPCLAGTFKLQELQWIGRT